MALIVATPKTGTGVQYDLAALDDIRVDAGVVVSSTNDTAISGTGSSHDVIVAGTVSAAEVAVSLGGSAPEFTRNTLFVAETGIVRATGADARAVVIQSGAASIVNYGLIEVTGAQTIVAIALAGGGEGFSNLVNYGSILGVELGIKRYTAVGDAIVLRNFGTLSAATLLDATLGVQADVVINRGVMVGDLLLGGGADVFNSRKGFITGTVYGGDGDDVFVLGRSEEIISGGLGRDTLDFRYARGLSVALDNAFDNTGVAFNDIYTEVEDIQGSLLGADRLRGNSLDNRLFGNGGADSLEGGAGRDTLVGGLGRDVLKGEAGDDFFLFTSARDGGDVIEDFSAIPGNRDTIQILGRAFSQDLSPGVLDPDQFQTGARNVASNRDIRFVFRLTDNTLWFDRDGSGRAKPVLLVDLPDGVIINDTDIMIV